MPHALSESLFFWIPFFFLVSFEQNTVWGLSLARMKLMKFPRL